MNDYEVGQVWITRDGREATIIRLLEDGHAVMKIEGTTGNGSGEVGEWWISREGQFHPNDTHAMDLIEPNFIPFRRRQLVDTIYGRI